MKKNILKTLFLALVMACALPMQAQNQTVTGQVLDELGEPVIGATVAEAGTKNATVTDLDGNYKLSIPKGKKITVSYIGYITQTVKPGGVIKMQEDKQSLEEVVVVGYGSQKKAHLTGSVATVDMDDVKDLSAGGLASTLSGLVNGLSVSGGDGRPGENARLSIRDVNSLGDIGSTSQQPLFVIDGYIYPNDVKVGNSYQNLGAEAFNNLDASEVESITVLKDASAAVYGARAANGVILVTTKQGKAGKIQLQYDGYAGWSNPYKVPDLLNVQQYMQIIDETNMNTFGEATNWSNLVPANILSKINNGWTGTNWVKEYENKNALQFSNAVTLTGGSENSKFSISLNYSSNEGIMGGDNASNYKRYGGRINSEHVLLKGKDLIGESHDIITIGENVSYTYQRSHDLAEGSGYWNIMQAAYVASPLVEPYNADGTIASYDKNGAGYSTDIYNNPLNHFLAGGYSSINKNRSFNVNATFYWIVEPVKDLKYRGQFHTGYNANNHRDISLPYNSNPTSASANYSLNMREAQSSSLSVENTLAYILPKMGKNTIDVLAGQSLERTQWSNSMNMSFTVGEDNLNSLVHNGWDFNIPNNYETQYMTGHGGYDNPLQTNIVSFFGRANWNYDEKYMATAIIRADGSNNFARGKRWGYFPSFSAGWVVSNEKFMERAASWLDFLKIRASWGQNGNCQIGNFYYLSNIGFSPTGYPDYGYKFSNDDMYTISQGSYTTGAYAKNPPNEDVTWETSEQTNIGLDARFLDGRLGLSFDWYVKMTKDWLVQAPMNVVLGYEEPAMINGGDIKNTGFELALSWRDKIGSDFNYHANVNVATNKNKVTRLAANGGKIGIDKEFLNTLFQGSSYVSLVEEGHPVGYFYAMSYDGIWQNQAQIDAARAAGKAVLDSAVPGDPIWTDYDGDGEINYDLDRHEVGNPNPDVTLGVSLGCEYKGFDFGITGAGAFGQQIMQCYRTAQRTNQYDEYTTDVFNRWHGEGTSNTQPRLTVGQIADQWVSTRFMQNGDYFKIQNVTLGYDFNKIWKGSPFSQLRLYVQAQNLYTFTGYTGVDPECSADGGKNADNTNFIRGIDVGLYPSARTFIVGASIKF
ncbi:MAG: TonB-dependent receptor [Prevotella sp.]|nr:TonB-dependent receptor [Prevotella sp.]